MELIFGNWWNDVERRINSQSISPFPFITFTSEIDGINFFLSEFQLSEWLKRHSDSYNPFFSINWLNSITHSAFISFISEVRWFHSLQFIVWMEATNWRNVIITVFTVSTETSIKLGKINNCRRNDGKQHSPSIRNKLKWNSANAGIEFHFISIDDSREA